MRVDFFFVDKSDHLDKNIYDLVDYFIFCDFIFHFVPYRRTYLCLPYRARPDRCETAGGQFSDRHAADTGIDFHAGPTKSLKYKNHRCVIYLDILNK